MKIVDCFMFYNEMDMLEYRLKVLAPYVDYFVVVESTMTHVGRKKPLYFSEELGNPSSRFAPFAGKIVLVVDNGFSSAEEEREFDRAHPGCTPSWKNEMRQRDRIRTGLEAVAGEDVLLIGDLDEIPNPEVLKMLRAGNLSLKDCGGASLVMDNYYYNLSTRVAGNGWTSAKMITFEDFRARFAGDPNQLRKFDFPPERQILFGGWHLSYFGNAEFIINKVKNFAHTECCHPPFVDPRWVEHCVREGKDLFARDYQVLEKVNIRDMALQPPFLDWLLEKFP